ncbi:guanine nucleotide exchange factor [Clohesyomyces aquaticus]|uniref:Guanine nucleotide exchange factor n=1 Tax=Clohesyomyces aquaticus TaxID=1231657 RepID=A0A1Y1Z2H4_9PLEO|nr:guanine nucleotide exchange factor [Clohesyomyces aquaticus]
MLSQLSSKGSGGKAKLEQVTTLLNKLQDDLDANKLPPKQRTQLLEELKVHGRAAENADPIFTDAGIRTLSRYAFESENAQTSQEALRCLANALLLRPPTRQILVDLGYAPKATEKLKSENIDDEFLLSRILFLMTYDTTLDYEKLVNEQQLAESINLALARHSKKYSKSARRLSQTQAHPMELMALSETLKLVFNITHFYPDLSEHFSKSIPHIFKILTRRKIPSPPLQAPVNYLVNALINLDLEDNKGQQLKFLGMNAVFPKFDAKCNAEQLINILDNAIVAYTEAELDNNVAPVLTLIRRVYEIAPDGVKKYMEWLLLPTDEERSRPLGKSDTLSARLLRLSTSAMTPSLRGSISAMMFELSGKDAAKFVHNVGYGFASGFLLSNNIQMPENAMEAHATGADTENAVPVNPVTGQRLDMEEEVEGPPMSQEEKEREAERLFVLFERLKATGVMNVQNPVEAAYRSGRIEELPDDASD